MEKRDIHKLWDAKERENRDRYSGYVIIPSNYRISKHG